MFIPVNPKGNESFIFTGRTDAEAKAPILWPPHENNWVIRKDSDAGKDRRQEKKGTIEDDMVGWYQWFNGHEFKQALRSDDGQWRLACCSPWDCKESEMSNVTELNWTESGSIKMFNKFKARYFPVF